MNRVLKEEDTIKLHDLSVGEIHPDQDGLAS